MNPKVKRYEELVKKYAGKKMPDDIDVYEGFTADDYYDLIDCYYDHAKRKKKRPIPVQALIYWQQKAEELENPLLRHKFRS